MEYILIAFLIQGFYNTATTQEEPQNIYHHSRVVATQSADGKIVLSSIENMKTEEITITSDEFLPDHKCFDYGCMTLRRGFHPDGKITPVH